MRRETRRRPQEHVRRRAHVSPASPRWRASRVRCNTRTRTSRRRCASNAAAAAAAAAGSSHADESTTDTARRASASDEQRRRFLHAVGTIAPLQIKQATPLPIFGPPIRPFFVGYFADVQTLLHNAAIVPEKVDIVLNPCSSLEFVLARESTDRVLFGDQLLIQAYHKLEKELQREFAAFFARCCPEVRQARSACVPLPIATPDTPRRGAGRTGSLSNASARRPFTPHRDDCARTRCESEYSDGVAYELVILIEGGALAETFGKMRWAKEQKMLMGHAALDVLPLEAAAPHVREAARVFYCAGASDATPQATRGRM